MATEESLKKCPMCRMDISAKARKCRHCHHYQNRLATGLMHPLFPALALALVLGAIALMITNVLDDFSLEDRMFEKYLGSIVVTDSTISFGESSDGEPTVVITGTLQNNSDVSWKDIYIEVAYFGPDGQLVDAAHCENRTLIVGAGSSAAFKVSSKREFPQDQYASHTAVVKWAKEIGSFP